MCKILGESMVANQNEILFCQEHIKIGGTYEISVQWILFFSLYAMQMTYMQKLCHLT